MNVCARNEIKIDRAADDFIRRKTQEHENGMAKKPALDTYHEGEQKYGQMFTYSKDFGEVCGMSGRLDIAEQRLMPNYMQEIWKYRGSILTEIREKRGSYDYSEIVDATGCAYAQCYEDIEEKYAGSLMKNGQTKEEELEELDRAYQYITDFDTANARVRAGIEKFKGNLAEVQESDLEAYRDSFHKAKEQYVNRYREKKEPVTLQNYRFELPRLFEQLHMLCWGNVR